MKIVIGFVTYNKITSKYLEYFLSSLESALSFLPQTKYQVLAFDNSSPDDNSNRLAIEFFEHQHKWPITYFTRGDNIGFGAAYNVMIKEAKSKKADYFLVINPDIYLDSLAIEKLIFALDGDMSLDAVSPKIRRWDFNALKYTKYLDSCGLIMRPGLNFKDLGQGELDNGQHDHAKILAPSGAAGLFRISSLEKIKDNHGYFDQRFFMYKEDCDLAYRFKLANLKASLIPEAIVYHDRTVTVSGGGFINFLKNRRSLSRAVRAWSFKNQHLLFVKYFWHEKCLGKIFIVYRFFLLFFFSLILEQFNLKQYYSVWRSVKP